MKVKVTKKEIRQNFTTVLKFGYCRIQSLLYYSTPFAYSCGTYGWSCDYYQIGNVCICTGNSPIGDNVNYELTRKFEQIAETIVCNYKLGYDEQKRQIDLLLADFIQSATN